MPDAVPLDPDGGWHDPWLPLEDTSRNAADQRADPESTLNFVRDVIALRRSTPDLRHGRYEELEAPSGAWAWRRGDGTVVAVNLGSETVEIPGVDGVVAIATQRARDGEDVAGTLVLDPATGVVVRV